MSYLASLFSGVASLCADSPWSAAADNGVWQALDLSTKSFEERANAGKLPCIAVDYQLQPSGEWGMVNLVEAGTAQIYYVAANDGGVKPLITLAEQFREYVWAHQPTAFQIIEWPGIRWDMQLPANDYFLRGGKPWMGVAVTLNVVVGVTQ